MNEYNGLRHHAAKTITTALTTGNLRHPNRPQVPLVFPGFDARGHHPEVADAVNQAAHTMGEALIDTVLRELDAELIPTTELTALRERAANTPAQLVTLTCKHRALLQVAVKPGTNTAEINCRRLRTSLTECENT